MNKRYEGEKEKTENGTKKWMQERIWNASSQKKIFPKERTKEWMKKRIHWSEKKELYQLGKDGSP